MYKNYFRRLIQSLGQEELRDYATPIGVRISGISALKLRNLFRDCFSSHVIHFFNAEQDKIVQSKQRDRYADLDNISNFFIKNYYQMPRISQSISRFEIEGDLGFHEFRETISTNPIVAVDECNNKLGTNKISFLIGEIGEGKSVFVSKLHQYFQNSMIEKLETIKENDYIADDYTLVPIVFDFEVSHKKQNQYLKDIDDEFWAEFHDRITTKMRNDKRLSQLSKIDEYNITPRVNGNPRPYLAVHIRNLITYLAQKRIRLLIIFDNLDRFYFRYNKHSLFQGGLKTQDASFNENMEALVNSFILGHFGTCGLCVLFVCRSDLYFRLDSSNTLPLDDHSTCYRLTPASPGDIISSRLKLLEYIETLFEPEGFDDFFNYLHRFFYLSGHETEEGFQEGLIDRMRLSPVFNSLCQLGHNNLRSLVRFFHNLSINPYEA